MICFTEIFHNILKKINSTIHLSFCSKEKAIRPGKELKSDFSRVIINPVSNDEVSSSTQSWKNKYDSKSDKIKSFNLLFFLLTFCNPINCPAVTQPKICNENNPFVLQIPCDIKYVKPEKKEKPKPVGLITRNKEMELRCGKLIYGCSCGKRNGLNGDEECLRSCCVNNPGCKMIPPQCWPQFKEPPEPPKPKMIYIPVDVVYYDPRSNH